MKNKFFPYILLFWAQVSTSQDAISLENCIEWAQNNSPKKEQLQLINKEFQTNEKILSRNYLPSSAINAKATWQSDVINLPIELPGVEIPTPNQDQYQLSLDINQSIWDGGRTNAQKTLVKANSLLQSQKAIVELYQLEEQVGQFYFAALLAEKLLTQAILLKDNLINRIAQVQAGIASGTAIRSNLQRLEASLLEAEQRIIETTQQKASSLASLHLLTGKSFSSSVHLQTPTLAQKENREISRPELQLIDAQRNVILANEDIIKANAAPKIGAFAQIGYGQPGLNFLAQDFNSFQIVGAQMQIPISNLYTQKISLEKQQLSIRSQIVDKDKELFLLQNQVQQTSRQQKIERLKALLETDRKVVALREDISAVASAQLENGIITSVDYLEEVNREDRAKQQLILHEIELLKAVFEWNHIIGK